MDSNIITIIVIFKGSGLSRCLVEVFSHRTDDTTCMTPDSQDTQWLNLDRPA